MSTLAALFSLVVVSVGAGADDLVGRLADADPGVARAAAESLRAEGVAGEESIWVGFEGAPAHERRARARWVLENASGPSAIPATALLTDVDARVRTLLVRFLGRVEVPDAERARVLDALSALATRETIPGVRQEIGTALATIGGELAVVELLELLERWPAPERTTLALALAQDRAARESILELVPNAFHDGAGAGLPPDVLGALLPAYARALADQETGGDTARDRAPLLIGMRHPAPEVRRGAAEALDELVRRLLVLERTARADRLLAALSREAVDPREVVHRRALHALEQGLDPGLALEAARELERLAGLGERRGDRRWRFRAAYLEGAAAIVAGEDARAQAAMERAEGLLEGLLAERADLATEGGREDQHELLHQLALLELLRVVDLLAKGRGASDEELLGRVREVHEIELRAQVLAADASVTEVQILDVLLEAGTSPFRLVFSRERPETWPVERRLVAEAELGRALATIAPGELFGFEPLAAGALDGRADPLADPMRKALLEQVLLARVRGARRERTEALDRLQARIFAGETIEPADEERIMLLDARIRRADMNRDAELADAYHDIRDISWMGLRHARTLRDEGRTREAREVCERMLAQIEREQLAQKFPSVLELSAELRMTAGSSWTADGEGVRAEDEIEQAVEQLEALEALLTERGAREWAAAVRRTRASALVSLAVNANVKLAAPERALEYFEQAYALHQDDFSRLLLACYRARSGQDAEARALVADVPVAPPYYYNLACTWALLGERERALDLLERELTENHPSEGSRRQQQEWARVDPDLAGLREDPRFRFLVGESEPARDSSETGGDER